MHSHTSSYCIILHNDAFAVAPTWKSGNRLWLQITETPDAPSVSITRTSFESHVSESPVRLKQQPKISTNNIHILCISNYIGIYIWYMFASYLKWMTKKLLQLLFFHLQSMLLFPSQYINNLQILSSGELRNLLPAPNGKCLLSKQETTNKRKFSLENASCQRSIFIFLTFRAPFNSGCDRFPLAFYFSPEA